MNETPLSRVYVDYLVGREKAARRLALADALGSAGLALEAVCLRSVEQSQTVRLPDMGHDVSVGEMPPPLSASEKVSGRFWFDTCEAVLMRCVPFEDSAPEEPLAWMSVRPVMGWQVRAFSDLAPIDGMTGRPMPVGDGPATGLSCGVAAIYAAWFGKSLCDRTVWEAAYAALGAEAKGLWGAAPREWAGASGIDEDLDEVIGPDLVEADPLDEYDDDDAVPTMLFPAGYAADDLGLRTVVRVQLGILQTPPSPRIGPPGVRLLDRLARW